MNLATASTQWISRFQEGNSVGKSWTQLIKKIAKEEREASKPCTVCSGTVISTTPLKIQMDQKKVLDDDFLILPVRVARMLRRGMITNGSVVLMIQAEGGQEYAVLDLLERGGVDAS